MACGVTKMVENPPAVAIVPLILSLRPSLVLI
jgi:hypothetical protein